MSGGLELILLTGGGGASPKLGRRGPELKTGAGPEKRSVHFLFVLAEIREAFKVLDRDGNGFISKQELGMAMRSLGHMPSEVELAIIMQRLDMDGESHTHTHTGAACVETLERSLSFFITGNKSISIWAHQQDTWQRETKPVSRMKR